MAETPIFFTFNRNPSITENIVDDQGAPVDLTTSTVKFKAREVGSPELLVDATATIVGSPTLGNVRYDWTSGDITGPAGILSSSRSALIWWEVTTGGKTQDVAEAVIEIRAHAPGTHAYVELEEFKETTSLKGQTYADRDIQTALVAASRGIEEALERRFWLDPDANQARYYTPKHGRWLDIDDLVTLTTLKASRDGDATFEETWTFNTDFVLEPLNAVADLKPYEKICWNPLSGFPGFPCYPRSVEVTGKFGWLTVPDGVKQLTTLIAARLVQRTRQAPMGIIAIGADGAAVRASEFARDPEYSWLVASLRRTQVLA